MADTIISFAGAPDANPYVPTPPWADAVGAGQVLNGGWRFSTGGLGNSGLWNTSIAPKSSGLIHMKLSTKAVDNSAFGVYICDESGNGYCLRVRSGDGAQIFNAVAWDTPTQIGTSEPAGTYEVDDVFDFYRDCDSGDMWIELDGVELIRRNGNNVTENLRGAAYSRGGRMGMITYVDNSGPFITSINDGQPVRADSTFTFTVSEGFTPTSGTIGGIPVTDIAGTTPNFTATMPAVVEGDEHPGYGTKAVVFTDGVDSPEATVVYAPRTGYAVHTIGANPDRSINGIGYLFNPELTQGDQIAAPSPAVAVGTTGGAPGTSATAGTHPCEHISSVDGIVRFFELRVGA